MATLTITIVTPDSDAMIADQLLEPTGTTDISGDPNAQSRVARYVDGVATGAFGLTSFTISIA